MSTPGIEPGPSRLQGSRYGLYAKVVPGKWGDFKLFIQTFRTLKRKWKMAFFSKKPSTIELCFLFGRATFIRWIAEDAYEDAYEDARCLWRCLSITPQRFEKNISRCRMIFAS